MKKLIRYWLMLVSFVFLVLFVRDTENMLEYSRLIMNKQPEAIEWVWAISSRLVPAIAFGVLSYYSFCAEWEKRWYLVGGVAGYLVFLVVGGTICSGLELGYTSGPVWLVLPLAAAVMACMLIPKIPGRRKLAVLVLLALGVEMIVAFALSRGWDGVSLWLPEYALPLLPLGIVIWQMPDKPVPKAAPVAAPRTSKGKKKHR